MGIHGVRAWGIIQERRPVEFSDEEYALYKRTFDNLTPQQFKKILKIGEWLDLERGHQVQTEGNTTESLTAMLTGEIEACKQDHVLGSYEPGDFIGLSCVVAGAPEFFDATVTRPARVMRWHYPEFRKMLDTDPELDAALRRTAAVSLATKLMKVVQPN